MNPAYLIFDIETVADGRLIQKVRYPNEKLSFEDSIEKYRAQLLDETGSDFIPYTFQLPVSVAIALVDSQYNLIKLTSLDRPYFRPQVITRLFWQGWRHYNKPSFVTFNGRSFDIPVLELSAFRYGIPLKEWMMQNVKSWDDPRNRFNGKSHIDLMETISNFGASRINGGLNLLSQLLGKPGKMDTKGDMVQDLYNAGEHKRIDDYCLCDALDTYFVFLRSRVMIGSITPEKEQELTENAKGLIESMSDEHEALSDYANKIINLDKIDDDDSPFLPDPLDESSSDTL